MDTSTKQQPYPTTYIDDIFKKEIEKRDFRYGNLLGQFIYGYDRDGEIDHRSSAMYEEYQTWTEEGEKEPYEHKQVQFLCRILADYYYSDIDHSIRRNMIGSAIEAGRKTDALSMVIPMVEAYCEDDTGCNYTFQDKK